MKNWKMFLLKNNKVFNTSTDHMEVGSKLRVPERLNPEMRRRISLSHTWEILCHHIFLMIHFFRGLYNATGIVKPVSTGFIFLIFFTQDIPLKLYFASHACNTRIVLSSSRSNHLLMWKIHYYSDLICFWDCSSCC